MEYAMLGAEMVIPNNVTVEMLETKSALTQRALEVLYN